MPKYVTLILLLFTVANLHGQSSQKGCKITIQYDRVKRKYVLNSFQNERCQLGKKEAIKYYFEIENPNEYKYDLRILSAKTVNFEVGIPGSLSAYFGLISLDQQPIPPGPKVIPVPQPFGEKKKSLSKLPTKDSISELEIPNSQLPYYRDLIKSYQLLNPKIKKYNDIYENINYVNTKSSKFLHILKNMENYPQGMKRFVDKELAKYTSKYGVDDINILADSISNDLLALDALKETIDKTIDSGLKVDTVLLTSIASINLSHKYVKNKIKITERLPILQNLANPKKVQTTESFYYTKNADAARINVALTNKYAPKDTVFIQKIDAPICKGMDIDFSTGFLYNSLWERNYFLDNEITMNSQGETDTTRVIKREDGFEGDITFGALVNFSFRRCWARHGPSLGYGIGLTDGKSRYFLGWHALFLEKQSLGISAGLVWSKVKSLSETVSDDGRNPNNPVPQSLSSVPTFEKMKTGYYIGVVWNFARK